MTAVVAIGAEPHIRGFAMAGALLLPAENARAVRAAWSSLPEDVALVVLTAAADEALGDRDQTRSWPLVAVMR